MTSMKVELKGDWGEASKILRGTPQRIKVALERAVALEAHYMVKQIVVDFRNVKPPLAPLTLRKRRTQGFYGRKALMRTGDLRNSIGVVQHGSEAFVGVARSSGKADIAAVHEYGKTIAIAMTSKMRRYIFGVIMAGRSRPREESAARGTGIILVRIPPRPFIRPAFEREKEGAPDRFMRWIARSVRGLGKL